MLERHKQSIKKVLIVEINVRVVQLIKVRNRCSNSRRTAVVTAVIV